MLACNKTVTLIHHEKGIDGDTYDCIVCNNASWFQKTTISTSADGAKPVNTYECRILTNQSNVKNGAPTFASHVVLTPAEGQTNTYVITKGEGEEPVYLDITPAPGDFVALGVIDGIEKPSDLKGVEHFRVTSVGDNRRGKLSHWRLSGQ